MGLNYLNQVDVSPIVWVSGVTLFHRVSPLLCNTTPLGKNLSYLITCSASRASFYLSGCLSRSLCPLQAQRPSQHSFLRLCCSTKSSVPLLTDGAAGWRSRHETSHQSSPVSHSPDTSDHTNVQRVGQAHGGERRIRLCVHATVTVNT